MPSRLQVGISIWTYVTSVFVTLLIHLNAASSEYTVKSAALDSFMAYRRLPKVTMLQSWCCKSTLYVYAHLRGCAYLWRCHLHASIAHHHQGHEGEPHKQAV